MAWALLLNSTKVIGSRYCTAVCTSMPCMKNAPSPAITTTRRPGASGFRAAERHPDAGTEAVAHAAHAERDREPAPPPHRQVSGSRPRRCCRHRRRCRLRRATRGRARPWRRGSAHPHRRRAVGSARCAPPRRAPEARSAARRRTSARVSIRSDARRSSVWTWVHGKVRRRRPDGDRPHRRQRIVEAGARGHRQPGADHQAQRRCRPPRRPHRDGPSRRSPRAPTTNRNPVCRRHLWRRAHMPPVRAAPPAAPRVRLAHRRGPPARRR